MEDSVKVKSLSKAITLLDILSVSQNGMTLTALSEKSGYPKSTVHALLSTMRDRGLVKQENSGVYSLGMKLFEYGCAVSRGMNVGAAAKPFLEKLSSLTGSTAVISMLDSKGAVSFDYAAFSMGIGIMPELGSRLPLHATSQGKLVLLSMGEAKAETLLRKISLPAFTPHTHTDGKQLLSEIAAAEERGYTVEDGEYKIGLRSVSAPVFDASGEMKYALTSIGFFRKTVTEDFRSAVDATVSQAALLSSALGFRPE